MQKCNYCGVDLSENSRFCGKCGSVQDAIATDAAATRSTTPQPPAWVSEGGTLATTLSPNGHAPTTPPSATEDEDEDRRGILSWPPLYGAALGGGALLVSGQPYTPPGAPVVQGTPQIGSTPSVAGSSTPYTNAPAAPPTHGAGNAAPVSHPVQGAGNAALDGPPTQGSAKAPVSHPVHKPVSHPVHKPASHPVKPPVKVPVSHPVKPPVKTPVSHPVQEPEQPGTEEHHPPHGPHRHHGHDKQHEHNPKARVTKAAGSLSVKTILLVVTIVVLVAAGVIGAVTHFLSRPQPLISITSNYKVGNALAGAQGTILHISGQQFSSNSAITLLLDGQVAPGNQSTRSDLNGNVSADVTITGAWSVGTHTLTARDASNYSTKNSVSVTIVQPGQANTPGPNGAPPDDATFTLDISAQGRNNTVNQPFTNNDEALHITGHPDPAGGTVCLDSDTGQQFSSSYDANNTTPFTETYTFSCQGSYKSGQISYTETLLTDVVTFTDGSGISCTLTSPQLNQQVTGSYTGNGTFTGIWTYGPVPQSAFSCSDPNQSFYYTSNQGTWTGTVSGL